MMSIDRIGPSNNIQPSQKSNKAAKTNAPKGADRIDISPEARAKADQLRQMDIIKSAPDIREEKVAQAKANLEKYFQNGSLDETVADALSDKLIDTLLG
jgi:negative regulator of flagellin synthesis FlgM